MTQQRALVVVVWLGTLIALGAYRQHVKSEARATYDWATAAGVVTSSSWGRAGYEGGGFRTFVAYSYEVDDEQYKSLKAWQYLSTPSEAAQVAERFASGSPIHVYFAPDEPSRSVLQLGDYPQGTRYWLEDLLVWFLFLAAGLLSLELFGSGINEGGAMNTERIASRMGERTTEELVQIWARNDRDTWTPEAFDAIRRVLEERKVPLPEQRESAAAVTVRRPIRVVYPIIFVLGITASVFSDEIAAWILGIGPTPLDVEQANNLAAQIWLFGRVSAFVSLLFPMLYHPDGSTGKIG